VLPPPRSRGEAGDEVEDEGEFGATDTRMAVMGIISFLPYFNWLVSEAQGSSSALPLRFSFDGIFGLVSCN
jgi:hypothetical protein